MSMSHHVTRFAPSPSGQLHLGNARTALFNWLAARGSGGRFVLRVEDTDAERSSEPNVRALLRDLTWLGLAWDDGPDVGGPAGHYRQSERAEHYAAAMQKLETLGLTYPCFCSPEELQLQRKLQIAAHRPPRYAGTCAGLSPAEVERRRAEGRPAATRFRVPAGRKVDFVDAIHGPKHFLSDDIGDFVIGRADGSAAFFLSNAVDDALMGVTLVLRGDDHLTNTPRQVLILEALGLHVPAYGHLPLLLATGGAPLSKRAGAASLDELRTAGYLPVAICNYLARLGHSGESNEFASLESLAAGFRLERVSRSAAHFDQEQLLHWQRVAVQHATDQELTAWLGSRLDAVPAHARAAFVHVVRGNVCFPQDVLALLPIVADDELEYSETARSAIAEAGAGFFDAAVRTWTAQPQPFKEWTRALGSASGRRGAGLFMPLRAALTGDTHGPELAPLIALIGTPRIERRLRAAISLAGATSAAVNEGH